MNGQTGSGNNGMLLRDRVARIIYPPFMVLLLALMAGTIFISSVVIYYTTEESIEPTWLVDLAPVLKLVGILFNTTENDASRALDTLYVAVIGLVMGVFLRRCAAGANRWEISAIVLFLLTGGAQLFLILMLPTPAVASLGISGGKEIVTNLSILLARNANISLAIFSAALGIQLKSANKGNSNG